MTQQGFEDYINAVYDRKSGTANSYKIAVRIIDQLFLSNDLFSLHGQSITTIEDTARLLSIVDFVCAQQLLYKKGERSFFDNVSANQTSYPQKGFCSAAAKKLLEYHRYDIQEKQADEMIVSIKKGTKVSDQLISFFDLDKVGSDKVVSTKTRIGQSYFRRMVLANYNNCCCVTGLNVPQTLRASHIVAWADDKRHRMDPQNGLCLSATYDAAFDKHLISFDEDYRMIVSKDIKEYYSNAVAKEYFGKFEGKKIIMPIRYLPSKALLERHRNYLVV